MFEILSQLLFEELSKKLIEGTATREERERYVSDAVLTRKVRAKLADYIDGRVRKAGEGEQLALALEAAQERASEIAGVPIEDLDAPACPVLDFHGRECLTGPTGHKGDHVYDFVERPDLPPTLASQTHPPHERAKSGPGAGLDMIADALERETIRRRSQRVHESKIAQRGRELHEQIEAYVHGVGGSGQVFVGGQRLYGMTDGMRYEPSGPVLASVPDPTPYPVKAGCAACKGTGELPAVLAGSGGVEISPVPADEVCPACGGSGASL